MERSEIDQRFAQYRDLLGEAEWCAMGDALERPLPATFWTHPKRATPSQVAAAFERDGHHLRALPYASGGYASARPMRWGRRIEFRTGLIHLQEAASMLPPLALKPEAGELVLDLCAAPGGKSAQLALMMENRGTLVVNDLSFSRLRALRATQERLGLRNMVLCAQEGQQLLRGHRGVFDKVLVDAPCSCEGTLRKRGRWTYEPDEGEFKKRLIETQRALLTQALKLTRPGGRVVYSTCTLDPWENEGVIDAVLSAWSREGAQPPVYIEPMSFPELIASAGIRSWKGRAFLEGIENTLRVYPHQNDSGGFFLASLRIGEDASWSAEESRRGWSSPSVVEGKHQEEMLKWVERAHGISQEKWADIQLLQGNQRALSAVSSDLLLPPTRYQVAGLPSIYTRGAVPRLTSGASLEWGRWATRSLCELTERAQVDHYYMGADQPISKSEAEEAGVCIVRHQGRALGLGYLERSSQGEYVLKSEYPKRVRLAEGCSAFEGPDEGERVQGPERPPIHSVELLGE